MRTLIFVDGPLGYGGLYVLPFLVFVGCQFVTNTTMILATKTLSGILLIFGLGRSKIVTPPVIFDPSHDVRLEIEILLGYRMIFRNGDPFHPQENIESISGRSGPDGAGYWIPLSHLPKHSSPIIVNLYDWDYSINVFDNR